MSELVILERHARVALLRLNRPAALNALNSAMLKELSAKLAALDGDPDVGCIALAGSEKAFAAGADIKEMRSRQFAEMFLDDWFAGWEAVAKTRTPLIAIVSGYALGGGCELALMCDMILASEDAQFGQPEIKLGVIPGMGGTQRLARAVGKALATDMILTGRMLSAAEALQSGLIARVFPAKDLLEESLKIADRIASFGKLSVMAAKETIARAFETGLSDGLLFERRVFHSLFATPDQKEGMAAFIQKRAAAFNAPVNTEGP